MNRFGFTCRRCANARSTIAFKASLLLFLVAIVGMFKLAHAGLVVSETGPDGGAQLISTSRFAAWRWGTGAVHLDVSVFARLAATASDVSFDGVADDPTDPATGYTCTALRVENRSVYYPKVQ